MAAQGGSAAGEFLRTIESSFMLIEKAMSKKCPWQSQAAVRIGRPVRIMRGPFKGLLGRLRKTPPDLPWLVEVVSLGSGVFCSLGPHCVQPAEEPELQDAAATLPFVEVKNVIANEFNMGGRRDIRASLPQISQNASRCCGAVWLPPPVERQARQRLLEDCPYAYYFQSISIRFENGVLTVGGRVPTFYLKQLIQSRLRNLDGVKEINNQVAVVSASGLSSEPVTGASDA